MRVYFCLLISGRETISQLTHTCTQWVVAPLNMKGKRDTSSYENLKFISGCKLSFLSKKCCLFALNFANILDFHESVNASLIIIFD